jgi:hypothetical protein
MIQWPQPFGEFNLLLASSWMQFWYVSVVSQVTELEQVFTWFIHHLYVVILFHILRTGREQYFNSYFYTKPTFLYSKV